ncbi:MAG: 3-oxoacyl-[acyl-carrier-protein] synthase 2 [Tepidiforma sp.]|uniref:beta-ketoacyl-ACP synthase II n=1 Tax=Tepidiforma sp. TaxID=2682230 RepID=UPI0021DF23DE|nr:beta-ketoacyl-ACP synthase II [Tepidiforma sp.]GIW15136.1 MAG: 3-oxoacyl-[acyl-carrier-protein] synthase 2 [Tepidiforma sp.]
MTRRVVVTGVGAVTAVGHTAEETWQAMLEGRSGIGPITLFDPEPYPVRIQAEVKGFELGDRVDPKQQRYMNRSVRFGVAAALDAVADSGLKVTEENADMVGVIFGSGAGGTDMLLEHQRILEEKGPRRITPFLVANLIPDAASGHIAIATGARGPNYAPVAACATGAAAIGEAFETIRRGDADAVITGSSEAVLLPIYHATWCSMRALASDNEHPEKALKPFDLHRDGFIAGEGACGMVLEEYEHARARGARIYCEVIGYGTSNDAYDMIALHETGRGLKRAVVAAIRKAGIDPSEIDYINPHGSGTPLNDRVETLVFKEVMGPAAYRAAISSVKPITGHCMGASGSVEALACVMAIRDQKVAPTINYTTPDPECDLDYVPNVARAMPVNVAMTTSVGLGGHNACLIFRKVD